ncbi:MAG: class I SAM-dependent methyltransferase [Bacteroidota bacterium]
MVLIRPEPLARNKCRWSQDQWLGKAHARFDQTGSTTGNWISLKKHPLEWDVTYKLRDAHFRFRLKLTKFKHVGVFPEQGSNWNFIFDKVQETQESKVLNLFAYTGGASLAARTAGAQTFHVDSIKQVISWSRENQELSGLDNIHWVKYPKSILESFG